MQMVKELAQVTTRHFGEPAIETVKEREDDTEPKAQTIGVLKVTEPPHMVAIPLKIVIPVGTSITIIAAVKYIFMSSTLTHAYG